MQPVCVRNESPRTRFVWTVVFVAVMVGAGLVVIDGPSSYDRTVNSAVPLASSSTGPSLSITDGQTISTSNPGVQSTLRDSLTYGSSISGQRGYTIHLTASVALPTVLVKVTTLPVTQWGYPNQMPGGGDNLPPLGLWSWRISDLGVNVTALWSATAWDQMLSGPTTWTNQTIWVRGSTSLAVTVTVNPTEKDGTYGPIVGFVLDTPGAVGSIPANDSTFTSTAAALHPEIIRFSTLAAGTSRPWNTAMSQPEYNFTYFDQLVEFALSVGAEILLSLPSGTWGDGNVLPKGMPLNRSIAVPGPAGDGYLPGNRAWVAFVEGIVNHTVATGEQIAYWTIGNEFPTRNQSLVAVYTNVFDLAEKTIHQKLPGALVGSDVMTNGTYEAYFATHARGVGFLSFHYYASATMCVVNGAYCPPRGAPLGSTDSGMFSHTAYQYLVIDNSPRSAQDLWYNETGKWLPIFNAETNLNPVGGSYVGGAFGSDPRAQTLFGATWLTSLLIDSAWANVSAVTYFSFSGGWGLPDTLTAPYGGWGYGLAGEAVNDTNVLYAPYFAMELWTESIPARAPGLMAVSSEPAVVHTYAAKKGSNLSVVLENRVNVPVSITLNETDAKYTLESTTTLDQTTYGMVYEPKHHTTVLRADGIKVVSSRPSKPVVINGYGVAVAKYSLTPVTGSQATHRAAAGGSRPNTASTMPRTGPGRPAGVSLAFATTPGAPPPQLPVIASVGGPALNPPVVLGLGLLWTGSFAASAATFSLPVIAEQSALREALRMSSVTMEARAGFSRRTYRNRRPS